MTNSRACIVASTNGLGTDVEAILVRMSYFMDKLRMELTTLVRESTRAASEELINLVVADFKAASVETSAAPGAGSVLNSEVVPPRSDKHMDSDILSSEPVPHPTRAGDADAIENDLAHLIGNVSPVHPPASPAVNVPYLARSDDDTPLTITHDPTSFCVTGSTGAAPSVAATTMSSEAESASGRRSALVTKQPSAANTSNRMAESTSLLKSGSAGVKRLGPRKKLGAKRASKDVEKPEKTGRRSKVLSSPEEITIKVPVRLAAASTAGASTGTSSTC